ncbi:leucyl/phenylalanyl-tRNA--protein transferase [Patiriisocius marinus]|uniref:Leucyl/phenylalanyl-tRNA--protein transferase n=1 Tax=Patiriisocius marinus TaxID=1397112 RepID=A0A5J4J3G8_9FLAO|nr:leucyl/phenylalanyl-tRNA--protein transferase [Patiriisocius marinus]GER60351.1 leucyl/phenylalanyl-tRNA--protein transferase [Patiriisocius marinus]
MVILNNDLWFPEVSTANEDGIIAIGGDLSPQRLILAYSSGIFPWFNEGEPVIWWSPDPRMVLFPENFYKSKTFRKTLRTHNYRISINEAFEQVIRQCAIIKRDGQGGTWITSEMESAYLALHNSDDAMSIEIWEDKTLVGGLYGVYLKKQKVFCGESMFHKKTDVSKIALSHLVDFCLKENIKVVDCQVYTSHLESLGAEEISRLEFLKNLEVN